MTQARPRRSIKNVVLTKSYHLLYMGPQAFITLLILGLIFAILIRRVLLMAQEGHDIPYLALSSGIALAVSAVGFLVCGAAVLSAHRMAGVHIKLAQVFDSIAEGRFETRLKFRSTDKLEDVESAFNQMMDSLCEKMPATTPRPKTEEPA